MKKLLWTLVALYSLLNAGQILAEDGPGLPKYIWDNQEGLKNAQHCRIAPMKDTKFRISTYFGAGESQTENLRNYNGVRQSHLINGSLLKLMDGPEKRNYSKIEVIGINAGEEILKNRWFSERLNSGYLYNRSLAPIEDYVIELDPKTAPTLHKESKERADYFKVHGKTHYKKMDCPEIDPKREYLLFHVYSKANPHGPSALVGVYWDETKVFANMASHKKLDSLSLIPTLLEDENLAVNMETEREFMENTFTEQEREHYTQESFTPDLEESLKAAEASSNDEQEVKTQQGLEQIVCIGSRSLNVRHKNLKDVIFKAQKAEQVKVFQSWGEDKKSTVIGGVEYNFVKVQFPNREEKDQSEGWVAENFIESKSDCKYIPQSQNSDNDRIADTQIEGLDDPNCCEFPTVQRATHPYTSGMRRFKAGRGGGSRLHAAADIYRYEDEPILSVAPGKIIRDRYYFYQGTYALEVVHSGGFIVRYGEITGSGPEKIEKGSELKMGERLGSMGVVNSGCCRPMLHFELYEGTKKGSLSQRGNKFQRRSDLMNPTPYLLRWEDEKF